MTKKVENLIEKCKSIIPFDGRVLVHPDKLRTYKEMSIVNTDVIDESNIPALFDDNGNTIDPTDPLVKTEQKEIVINKRFQTATVLTIPEGEDRFKIGDTIIYNIGTAFEFDLIKGVSILQKYSILAQQT